MIQKHKLSNGLALITESMPHVRSVTIGVWLRRGSRDEPARTNGISHFIEHLVFKGTEGRSARDIALAMDSVGGQMDAFTSKEYTCFYARVLDEHLPETIDLLADIVQRPLFDATELERERQVVLEEIRMVEDTPDDLIYDLFSEHYFPRHPLGRPIQGTEQTVGALSRRQLLNFFRGAYRPRNMLIVAAGNLKHANVARMCERGFGDLDRGRNVNGRASAPRPHSGVFRARKNELGQLHLLLGLPAYARTMSQRYRLYVLNAILGGTMSSRLFHKIREERGLAYSVYSAVNAFMDAGVLNIYAATNRASGSEVIGLVRAELAALVQHGPTEDELRVAKENLKGSLMLSLESTSSRMSNLARQEIYYGRQLTLEETLGGVSRVTRAAVHRTARELLEGQQLSLAVVGPTKGLSVRSRDLAL
ncbi:MAG: insulinase family protein [bacterium]|nr:insulinase family protein [bacterium]